MEAFAVWLLIEVGRRLQGRALDEFADHLYDRVTDAGRPILRHLIDSIRGRNSAAIEVAATTYGKYLESSPDEGERVVVATLESAPDPMVVIEAILRRMCSVVAQLPTVPAGSQPAGVAAFAGSFSSASHVSVIDVRDGEGGLLASPERQDDANDEVLTLQCGVIGSMVWAPRLWILIVSDPSDRDALVDDLNLMLWDKRGCPPVFSLPGKLSELGHDNASGGKQIRAKVRAVQTISGDKLTPHYPDPVKDAARAAANDLTAIVMANLNFTEVDALRRDEEPLFDIDRTQPDGVKVLLESVAAMERTTTAIRRRVSETWSDLTSSALEGTAEQRAQGDTHLLS